MQDFFLLPQLLGSVFSAYITIRRHYYREDNQVLFILIFKEAFWISFWIAVSDEIILNVLDAKIDIF